MLAMKITIVLLSMKCVTRENWRPKGSFSKLIAQVAYNKSFIITEDDNGL